MKKGVSFIKKNYISIIFCICVVIFLAIAEDVYENEIMKIDVLAYSFFVENLRTPSLTHFMTFITSFGNIPALLLIVIASIIFLKDKKISLCIIANLFLITLINQGLKFLVQRPRPEGYRLIMESGYSFPSGHSMVSVAFFGFFIYLVCKYVENNKRRYLFYILLITLILLICVSRIYLGVHYASDVVAGALISVAYLLVFIKFIDKYILNKKV